MCLMQRFDLINRGLYPETTPPCFISKDAKRAFHGLVGKLDAAKFHNHKSEFTRVRTHNQNNTIAASAMAERKISGHLS